MFLTMNLQVSEGVCDQFHDHAFDSKMVNVGFPSTTDEAAYATYLEDLEARLRQNSQRNVSLAQDVDARGGEKIPFPDTELARSYLKKKDEEIGIVERSVKYEEAYVELSMWFLLHSKTLGSIALDCPHAIGNEVLIKTFQESPPNIHSGPALFGYNSWKDLVEKGMDHDGFGYISRSDIGRFWDRFGIRYVGLLLSSLDSLEVYC